MRTSVLLGLLLPACGVVIGDDEPPDGGGGLSTLDIDKDCEYIEDAGPIVELRCYTCWNACSGDLPSYCKGDWPEPATSCLKRDQSLTGVVYRWYEAGSDDPLAHQEYLRPFVLLGYMRKLRAAAADDASYAAQLDHQLTYVLDHSKTYAADALGPRSTVWQSHYVRASDGAARSYADGLNQAGYAFYFLSLAKTFSAKRDYYIALAIQADNAMERTYGNKTGGIRRNSATSCGGPNLLGTCSFFHSRAPENRFEPGTALNQSLYVMRSAADLLGELGKPDWTSWPTAPELDREAWRERLRDRIAAAMNQWAYGVGNSAAAPLEPPKLGQYARRKGTYYWADYEFDIAAHQSLEVGTHQHMCNYHTVTVNNLGFLLRAIDSNADGTGNPGIAYSELGSGTRYDRIMQARAMLLTYTSQGVPEAIGATSAHPLYQWFVSEVTPAIREGQEACPPAGEGGTERLQPEVKNYLCRKFGFPTNPAVMPCGA